MKLNILLIFLVSILLKFYSQNSNIKLDKDYFVLGTLNDEMGRVKKSKDNQTVENSVFDNFILKYNFNLLKSEYKDLVIDSILINRKDWYGDSLPIMETSLKSKKLASKINLLYDYNYDSQEVEVENGEVTDSIARGILKKNIFKNKYQMLSFMAGVYCIYGVANEPKYCIQFINSSGKYQVCEEVLKKLGCKKVELIVTKAIPWSETIYFEPTDLLKSYLIEFESVRMKIIEERSKTSKLIDVYQKKSSDRINGK